MTSRFYSFITYSQLSVLKKQRLAFAGAPQLNDEFLENKKVHRKPQARQERLSDSEFESALKPAYDAMAENMKAMVTWEYYLDQAKQNREKIEPQLQRKQAAKSGEVPLASHKDYDKVCLLQLFESLGHISLWQSYGDNHEGIALELDASHEFFQGSRYKDLPQLFAPVTYDDARPPKPSKANPFPGLLRRPEHLVFQSEHRLIRPLAAVDKQQDEQSYFKLPKGLLTGIYVGLECPAHVSEELLQLVQTDLMFKRIPLWHMVVSDTHLRLVPMSLTD